MMENGLKNFLENGEINLFESLCEKALKDKQMV